jgi:phage gpG-like protein
MESNEPVLNNPKEQLVNNIKEWIKMDNEMSQLKKEMKERTNKKKILTENLVSIMRTNQIDCFDINGGTLIYKKNKVKKPISGKTLLESLQKYYKNDTNIAEEITKHVMDSREEQIKETIKRKIDK